MQTAQLARRARSWAFAEARGELFHKAELISQPLLGLQFPLCNSIVYKGTFILMSPKSKE